MTRTAEIPAPAASTAATASTASVSTNVKPSSLPSLFLLSRFISIASFYSQKIHKQYRHDCSFEQDDEVHRHRSHDNWFYKIHTALHHSFFFFFTRCSKTCKRRMDGAPVFRKFKSKFTCLPKRVECMGKRLSLFKCVHGS